MRIGIEKRAGLEIYSRGNGEVGIFQDYVFLGKRSCGDEDLFCDMEKLSWGEDFSVDLCFGREDFEF